MLNFSASAHRCLPSRIWSCMLAMLNMELDMRRQSCGLHDIDMVILHAKIGSENAMLLSPDIYYPCRGR